MLRHIKTTNQRLKSIECVFANQSLKAHDGSEPSDWVPINDPCDPPGSSGPGNGTATQWHGMQWPWCSQETGGTLGTTGGTLDASARSGESMSSMLALAPATSFLLLQC